MAFSIFTLSENGIQKCRNFKNLEHVTRGSQQHHCISESMKFYDFLNLAANIFTTTFNSKLVRQYTFNVTLRRNHCNSEKAIIILCYECVFVALVIQHVVMRMRRIMLS
jgi:hypothetical protein